MTRLLLYNIGYCMGMTGRWYEYLMFWKVLFPPKYLDRAIIKTLKNMNLDILALVEVDKGSCRTRWRNSAKMFETELGMTSMASKVKYRFCGLKKPLKFVPVLRKQANAILSKTKLHDIRYNFLHDGIKCSVIEATIMLPKKITLLLVHLSLGKKTRQKQIKELITLVNSIKNPVILMGDFNTFSGDKEIKTLLSETDLVLNNNNMTQPTYKPKRQLDYVLTSKKIKVKDYKVLKFTFSDHLPIMVDFKVI